MNDMNAQCQDCGYRGERGVDVIMYRIWGSDNSEAQTALCAPCAEIYKDFAAIHELADQAGGDFANGTLT